MRFLIHLNGVEVGAVTWEALGRTLTSTPKILLASVQVALLSLAYLTPPFLFSLSTTPSQPQPALFHGRTLPRSLLPARCCSVETAVALFVPFL